MSAPTAKERAIETHSEQAAEFAAAYADLERDPYTSCFAYSRKRLDALLARLLPEAGPGRRLLDVGCGTGHQLARLRAQGYEVAGVDGSASMLARAAANNPGVDLRLSDVESLPFAAGRFDLTLCIEVLRYLPDPADCLREMARVLRPGGVCLATAAPLFNLNGYYVVNRVAILTRVAGLVPLRQFFSTGRALRAQFRRAGFGRVDIHGVYLGPVNWVERLAPRALPAALRRWERMDAALCDRPVLRELANMFLVRAEKDP